MMIMMIMMMVVIEIDDRCDNDDGDDDDDSDDESDAYDNRRNIQSKYSYLVLVEHNVRYQELMLPTPLLQQLHICVDCI